MEIPPDFPIPPNTQGDMQPLTHGCWRIEVVPSPDAPVNAPPAQGRLPRIVRQGAEGTANSAPPFTTGLVGIFSQMTPEHWLLDIQQAPPPEQHEPGTMLLSAGDKLLFERVDGEWIIRVEHLNPDAPEEVRRLRESNTPTPSPTKPRTTKHDRGRSTLPSIPEHDDPPAQSNSGASSSHEAPQSYYPPIRKPDRPPTDHPEDQDTEATRPVNNQPAAATTGPHQPRPSFVDDRQLRRSQRSQAGSPSIPTQASPPNHGRPSDTPLAAQLRDGRQIGPKPPPKEDSDPQQDKDDPSFMQQSLFSAPLTQQSYQNPTTDDVIPSNTSQPPQETSLNQPAATAVDGPSQTPTSPPHQYPPTTPGDTSMPLTATEEHEHIAAAPNNLEHQASAQPEEADRERSWQRVERHLVAIRQLANDRTYGSSNSAGIIFNADQALVNLLVDTPTAEELDTPGDNPVTSHASRSITNQAPTQLNPDRRGTPLTTTTTRQRAEAAAAALANIARQQMANTGECISYGLLEPHVAALMDWIAMLPADDIAARVQLPPVLTPLRGVLERVLQRRTDSNDWAALVAVAEAMAALCSGSQLTHQADVVAIAAGGLDSPLLEGGQRHEEWETAVLLLRQLAGEIPNWPASRLPTVQEAAMQLVRGISSHIPEGRWGQPGAEDTWWMSDRHHGLGDMAVYRGETSPRERHPRRQRSSSSDMGGVSDASHRRRRLLAAHFHDREHM